MRPNKTAFSAIGFCIVVLICACVGIAGAEIVDPVPPWVGFLWTPDYPLVGESITFDGGVSMDDDGYIVSYAWDFGDGSTGSGMRCSHTFTSGGEKRVTLTVTDDDGLTGTKRLWVWVIPLDDATQGLAQEVDNLNLPDEFANGVDIETGLLAKLSDAQESFDNENIKEAENILKAFERQVEAQRGKTLTDEEADALIAYSQRILAAA